MTMIGETLRAGTLIVNGLHKLSAPVAVFTQAMAWLTMDSVKVNAYLTAGDAASFRMRADVHDVLVVQISGHKHWEIRGASRPFPVRDDIEPNREQPDVVLWSGTLAAGDVMLVPRGYWHVATRVGDGDDGHSLHLAVGIKRVTPLEWIKKLAEKACANEKLRADSAVHRHFDGPQKLIREVGELAAAYPPAVFERERRAEMPVRQHVPYVPGLGPLEQVTAITAFPPHIDKQGDTLTVSAGGRYLTFPYHPEIEYCLRLLLSGHPIHLAHSGGDPAHPQGKVARGLAEVLVRDGLCAPCHGPLAAGYTGLVETLPLCPHPGSAETARLASKAG
jgi:hypothetical protein